MTKLLTKLGRDRLVVGMGECAGSLVPEIQECKKLQMKVVLWCAIRSVDGRKGERLLSPEI